MDALRLFGSKGAWALKALGLLQSGFTPETPNVVFEAIVDPASEFSVFISTRPPSMLVLGLRIQGVSYLTYPRVVLPRISGILFLSSSYAYSEGAFYLWGALVPSKTRD